MQTNFTRWVALVGILLLTLVTTSPVRAQFAEDDPFTEAMRRMEQLKERFERAPFGRLTPEAFLNEFAPLLPRPASAVDNRLGVMVAVPPAVLAEQLDLPAGQGLVLNEVRPDSPADQAGLKKFDILLELNGQPVPNRVSEFRKFLAEVASDKALDASVLRKGTKVAIKGLKLAEPLAPRPLGLLPLLPQGAGANRTLIQVNNGRFTVSQKSGNKHLQVQGHLKDGKLQIESATIEEDGVKKEYGRLEDNQ